MSVVAVEEEDARLRRDREPDLVRDLEPVAALEVLLGEKDPDEPPELLLILGREKAVVRHVALDDREPIGGERRFREACAAPLLRVEHMVAEL